MTSVTSALRAPKNAGLYLVSFIKCVYISISVKSIMFSTKSITLSTKSIIFKCKFAQVERKGRHHRLEVRQRHLIIRRNRIAHLSLTELGRGDLLLEYNLKTRRNLSEISLEIKFC